MKRLAIITTHPIQYYAPIFKLLHARKNIEIKVFYTLGKSGINKYDPGFKKTVEWDIPLLEGYVYEWVKNTSAKPGSNHFNGIINPDIITQINTWRPSAILVYGWAYKSHLKVIRYFKNKTPVYFRGDSTILNEKKNVKSFTRRLFLRWVYKNVDHAFYVGTNNKNYYKKYGLKDSQLSFAPHAIDNGRFEYDHPAEADGLRSSLNISKQNILILYAGKFEDIKNVELLLSAFINLKNNNVHLLLVGNGDNEEALKSFACKSAGTGNIHFLGFKNQSFMPVLYQAADLFCLPSKSETWGLSVNEAMACGRAILVSDKVGCAVDLVKPNINGSIFNCDNIMDITQKLNHLTKNKELLIAYGKQSRIMIKDWNFTNIAEAIEDKTLYETH